MFTIEKKDGRFYVESAGKYYEIFSGGFVGDEAEAEKAWQCTCPGYQFRGKCKHLAAFLENGMAGGEGAPEKIEIA